MGYAAKLTTTSRRLEAAYRIRRRTRLLTAAGSVALLLGCLAASAWVSDADPATLAAGLPRAVAYLLKMVPDLRWAALLDGPTTEGSLAYWFYRLDSWAWLLFETSQMAALATLLGGVGAFMLCFPAAANLAPAGWLRVVCKRSMELLRSVPDLVYALILVWAFGIGPLAGILAIALHTAGALGKLFFEVVENADMRPWDGVRAAGGTWLHGVRFAILPQVRPNFLSYLLLRFEINVRGATVIGFVGAGGIGQELYQVISFNYYQEISAIVVLIIGSVALIDMASERLRVRAIGIAP